MAKQSTTTRRQAGSERPKRRKAESAPSKNGQDVSSFEQELAEYLQERIKPGLNRGAIPLLARSIAKDIARRAEDAPSGDDDDSNSTEAESDEGQAQAEADDTDVEDTEAEADDDAEAEADYDEEAEADYDDDDDDDDTEAEADDDYDDEGDETEATVDDDYEGEGEETEAAADDDEGDGEYAAEANGNGSADFEADMRELQGELGDDWILRFSVHGDESWLTAEKDDGSQRVQASSASVLSEVVELLNDDG